MLRKKEIGSEIRWDEMKIVRFENMSYLWVEIQSLSLCVCLSVHLFVKRCLSSFACRSRQTDRWMCFNRSYQSILRHPSDSSCRHVRLRIGRIVFGFKLARLLHYLLPNSIIGNIASSSNDLRPELLVGASVGASLRRVRRFARFYAWWVVRCKLL